MWPDRGSTHGVSLEDGGTHSLTLMRPPVVKRQTPPRSGFLPFFPLWFRPERQSASGNVFCLHFRLLVQPTWLHQTLIEVLLAIGDDECRERS